MLAFQLVRVLLGLDLGLTKVCTSERTEMELVEVTEVKMAMLGLVSELELDAELGGKSEMELVEESGTGRSEIAELCWNNQKPPRCPQNRPR